MHVRELPADDVASLWYRGGFPKSCLAHSDAFGGRVSGDVAGEGARVSGHRHQPAAPALLPSDYCSDVHLRLSFYKKLAIAKTTDQVDALLEEIVDRFGKLPAQSQTLIDVHLLRCLGSPMA